MHKNHSSLKIVISNFLAYKSVKIIKLYWKCKNIDEAYLWDLSSPSEVNFSMRLPTLYQELKTIDKKIRIVCKVSTLPVAFFLQGVNYLLLTLE